MNVAIRVDRRVDTPLVGPALSRELAERSARAYDSGRPHRACETSARTLPMEILEAVDALDDLIAESPSVPLTDFVRTPEGALRDGADRLRRAASALFGPAPARVGPTRAVFDAIQEIELLVEHARRIPLTAQLRVDRETLFDLLDRLRVALPDAIAQSRGTKLRSMPRAWSEAFAALDELDGVLHRSAWGLRDVIRVDGQALRAATSHLRRSIAKAIGDRRPSSGAAAEVLARADEFLEVVSAAKALPLSNQVRVPGERIFDALDPLRAAMGEAAWNDRVIEVADV